MFEHLESLGKALGILLGPWGLLWDALEGPGGALGGPSGLLGDPWRVLEGSLGETLKRNNVFSSISEGADPFQGNLRLAEPGQWEG